MTYNYYSKIIIQDRMNIKNTFRTKFYYEFKLHNNTYAVQFYICIVCIYVDTYTYTFSIFDKAIVINLHVYIYENICKLYYLNHLANYLTLDCSKFSEIREMVV